MFWVPMVIVHLCYFGAVGVLAMSIVAVKWILGEPDTKGCISYRMTNFMIDVIDGSWDWFDELKR